MAIVRNLVFATLCCIEAASIGLAQDETAGRRKPAYRVLGADRGHVAIVGSDVVLKNMESGEQHETETANVIPTILRGSRLS